MPNAGGGLVVGYRRRGTEPCTTGNGNVALDHPRFNCDARARHCPSRRSGEACAEVERYEFQFVCAPLVIWGGTGSPVNPLAVL